MNLNQLLFHLILIVIGVVFLGIGIKIKQQNGLLKPVFYIIGVVFLLLGVILPFLLFG
jgi:pilus assembly protein TadC